MTNEELAALAKSDRTKLPELWAQVEKFAALMARKRLILSDGMGGVEFEDLYQSGYLALVAAVDTYDPAASRSFISWFALALKTAFAEAGGFRSRKQARDPLHRAGSLDAPISGDEDNGTPGTSYRIPAPLRRSRMWRSGYTSNNSTPPWRGPWRRWRPTRRPL